MSHRRIYVLTIPLSEGSLPGCRTLAQIILRRRSDGPIIVRDEGKGPLTANSPSIQAIFPDQLTLDTVKGELRRLLPHVPMLVRLEDRRSHGRGDPPCSCVLLGVQGDRPCYYHQETCLRHCELSGGYTPPESGRLQEQVTAILRQTSHPGWAVVSPDGAPLAPSPTIGQTGRSFRAASTSIPNPREKRYQRAAHS